MELTINEELLLHVKRNYKNQAEAAKSFGISQNFLSMAINAKRRPNKAMLDALGYEKKVVFVKKCL